MKFEDLKQDSYVRWVANRQWKGWNTYGKVISLTADEVVILTYDDMKETKLNKSGEAIEEEVSLCSKQDVVDYFSIRIAKLNTEKAEAVAEFDRQIRVLRSWQLQS